MLWNLSQATFSFKNFECKSVQHLEEMQRETRLFILERNPVSTHLDSICAKVFTKNHPNSLLTLILSNKFIGLH